MAKIKNTKPAKRNKGNRNSNKPIGDRLVDVFFMKPKDLAKLYRQYRNRPLTPNVAHTITNIVDHRLCPRRIIIDAADRMRRIYIHAGMCLAGVVLRTELDTKRLIDLTGRATSDDVIDHGLGRLLQRSDRGDKAAQRFLHGLLDGKHFCMPSFYVNWLRKAMTPKARKLRRRMDKINQNLTVTRRAYLRATGGLSQMGLRKKRS